MKDDYSIHRVSGVNHIIGPKGEYYKDVLVSHGVKAARENDLYNIHDRLAHREPNPMIRAWHFKLRNNAYNRMRTWQCKSK